MRLVPVTRAEGLLLARDLPAFEPGQLPMLRAGARVTERYQQVLAARGIHGVWVEDDLSEGVTPSELIPEAVRHDTAAKVHRALGSARQAFNAGQELPAAALADFETVVETLMLNLIDSPEAALALTDLAGADAYTHRHSVNVCALGLLIGREHFKRHGWVDYKGRRRHDKMEERLAKLGMGLLLHDIGKIAVPADVLNKPGKLTDDEWLIMRTHPEAGAGLLNPVTISPLVIAVVRDHHERYDGTGYPNRTAGTKIPIFARIAAVADVYDAVTSERVYKRAEPPRVGVSIITQGSGSAFCPEVVEIFRRLVFPYPVGSEVTLPDGRAGVVCRVDPDQPERPVVRVAPDEQITVDMRATAAA